MNYNRRSTRPDGMFYRETRKVRGSPRGRGVGGMPVRPIGIAAIAIALAIVAFWLFRR